MRKCRECGVQESELVPFKKSGNICQACNTKYMAAYRKANREKLSQQTQNWKDENREAYRESCREHYATPLGKQKQIERSERTYRSWFSHLLSRIGCTSKNPGPHDPKEGPKRDFDIDLDYVMEILNQQKEKCAITKLSMNHQFNDLRSASIDRIDSEKGHVRGNIQIICSCVNMMKRHHPQRDILDFFDQYFQERLRREELSAAAFGRALALARPNYTEIAKKVLAVEPLPQGAVVRYERDEAETYLKLAELEPKVPDKCVSEDDDL